MKSHRVSAWVAVVFGVVCLAGADDGTTLKYRLKKGDRLIYRTKVEMTQSQEVGGMELKNQFNTETVQSFTVDTIDEKGNYQLNIKGEHIQMNAHFDALGDFKFDSKSSERDKSSVIGAAVTPLFERLSGAVFRASVSPEGEVLSVSGYSDLIRDLVQDNPITAQFAGGGSDDAAREGLREIFPRLNKSAVKPGDTWDVPFEISLAKFGKTKGKSMYRFVGLDKDGDRATAKLEVTADTSVDLDIEMDGVKVTGTIATTGATSTVHFDIDSGHVLSSEGSMTLAGTLNVNANGMDIPVKNQQTIKSKVEYLEKLPD